MAGNTIQRKASGFQQCKLAFAVFPGLPVVGDPGMGEAHACNSPPDINVGVVDFLQLGHDAAVNKLEVPHIAWQLVFAELVDQPVEAPTSSGDEETFLTTSAYAVDHTVPGLPLLEELRDQIRWILQVAVQYDGGLTMRVTIAC